MLSNQFDDENKEAVRESEIQKNIEWLESGDPSQRKSAIKRLGDLQAKPEIILSFLGDTDLEVRVEAAKALSNFGDMISGDLRLDIIGHLIGALNDPSSQIISSAARALGILQAKEAIPEIRELLDEDEFYVVRSAIIALARLEDHTSLERILSFLDSPLGHLKQAAWRAVGFYNYTPVIPTLLSNLKEALEQHPLSPQSYPLVSEYIDVCKRLRVKAATPMIIQIIQTEVGLRTKAVSALLELEVEKFPLELLELLDDPSPRLRVSILRLVYQTQHPVQHILLRKLLHDESQGVRLGALDVACQTQDTRSIPTVRYLCYRDPKTRVRAKAVETLVKLAGLKALPDLHTLAADNQPVVRFSVANSMGNLSAPLPNQAVAILEYLRNDDQIDVQEVADAMLKSPPDHNVPLGSFTLPRSTSSLPDDWIVTRSDFLSACNQWYSKLAKTEPIDESSEEIFDLQSALAILIAVLSRDQ
jgi:HEAT repeat protein